MALPALTPLNGKVPCARSLGRALGGSTVLSLVLFATYIGIGALAHDTHFSLAWALAARFWSGPGRRRSS